MKLRMSQVRQGDWIIPAGRSAWLVCTQDVTMFDGATGLQAHGRDFWPADESAMRDPAPYFAWTSTNPHDELEVVGWAPGLGDPAWMRKMREAVVWS